MIKRIRLWFKWKKHCSHCCLWCKHAKECSDELL